jgi:hypothetical protein
MPSLDSVASAQRRRSGGGQQRREAALLNAPLQRQVRQLLCYFHSFSFRCLTTVKV